MIEHHPNDIEESLGRLVPITPSSGLRQRVMDSALEARKNVALTPRMRVVTVVCSILIGAILGADSLLRRYESAQMAALLDGRPSVRAVAEDASDLAEVMGGQGADEDAVKRLQILAATAARKSHERNIIEARKELKGWLENENFENIN